MLSWQSPLTTILAFRPLFKPFRPLKGTKNDSIRNRKRMFRNNGFILSRKFTSLTPEPLSRTAIRLFSSSRSARDWKGVCPIQSLAEREEKEGLCGVWNRLFLFSPNLAGPKAEWSLWFISTTARREGRACNIVTETKKRKKRERRKSAREGREKDQEEMRIEKQGRGGEL